MTSRGAAMVAGVALLVAVVSALVLMTWPSPVGPAATTPVSAPAAAPAGAGRTIKARLFYVSDDGARLTSVEREVPFAEGSEQAREIINAQIAPAAGLGAAAAPGGAVGALISAVPAGTALRAVYITGRGDAYVDLSSEAVTAHPGGTLNELLTIYTIVNALTVNLPAVQSVQILIDGKEVATLAGHVDLRQPLAKNLGLVQ
ncbi:MAG TPA: GerMN domain-containing protein [Vicinamibacterales bacterium]